MEDIITLIIVILMLMTSSFIGSLILVKSTKKFYIKFGLTGFEISGSFFNDKKK